ncbi:uncharacterized protein LOC144074606 [Stigmatopora argus]
MFSRNRSGGQHGASVPPKGGVKSKKRAPNPKVALVIRGKIHRLLQGSADHRLPDSELYYEDEAEREKRGKDRRRVHPEAGPGDEACSSALVSNGKGHAGPPQTLRVGEAALTREGCLRIPCTLQRKSGKSPAGRKRISFEGLLPLSPEPPPPTSSPLSAPAETNRNGISAGSPRVRPKRPYSTGDALDYDLAPPLPGPPEPEGGRLGEEESSAVIDHILKELRGINKIQEEISDLRDYLTSVKGSVEEVSSCVDAVLVEIEGIRSSEKADQDRGTWSGASRSEDATPTARRRPASAYGSLGSATPKSNRFPDLRKGEPRRPRADDYSVSPITESDHHLDPEELEDTSDLSSDIPEGALARKLSFGRDCLSTSSLSSQSSKSESDLERPTGQTNAHWSSTNPPHGGAGEHLWDGESSYSVDPKAEAYYERVFSYDRYATRISGERDLVESGRYHSTPHARTSSRREDWQTRRSKSQPGFQTNLRNYGAESCSYLKSSGHRSFDENYGSSNGFSYDQSGNGNHFSSYEERYSPYDNASGTWASEERPFVPQTPHRVRHHSRRDLETGFNVKRISRAVSDFSSALRGALRKLEVPPDRDLEEATDFDGTGDLPPKSFSWDLVSQNFPYEEEEDFPADGLHYPSLEHVTYPESPSDSVADEENVPENWPSDQNLKSPMSRGTTTESLSVEEPQGLVEGKTAAPQPEDQNRESNLMDESKMKCGRSFQQILREKREIRRNLASAATSSREGFDAGGSQDGDQVSDCVVSLPPDITNIASPQDLVHL